MAEHKGPDPIPVFNVPAPPDNPHVHAQRPQPVSTTRLVPDQAQVMVDQWGHRGEFVKGMIVSRADADQAQFDFEHAVRVGAIRLLTEAEARSYPTTVALLPDGSPDVDHQRAMQFNAGIYPAVETVTTEQGPAEPKEFAKPTLEGPTGGAEPAHPVRIASAEEAEAGAPQQQVVPTSAGPAFALPEDEETEQRRAPGRPRRERSE